MRSDLRDVLACPRCDSEKVDVSDAGVACPGCGARFAVEGGVPVFSRAGLDVVPKEKSDRRDPRNWTPWRRDNYLFFREKLSGEAPGGRVLDLGSGPGHFRGLFEGARILAADFHPYPDVDVVCDVTQRLPLRSGSFDTVILSNVLEHVRDPAALLAECRRALRPGGRLLLTVPFLFKLHQEPHDYHRYTHHMLALLLEEAGFAVEETRKLGSIVDLHRLARRELSEGMFGPGLVTKLRRLSWRVSDAVRDRLLVDASVREDPERAYFTGYACAARKGGRG